MTLALIYIMAVFWLALVWNGNPFLVLWRITVLPFSIVSIIAATLIRRAMNLSIRGSYDWFD